MAKHTPEWRNDAPSTLVLWLQRMLMSALGGLILLLLILLGADLWIGYQARGKVVDSPDALSATQYGVVLGTSKYYSGGINPFYQARMDAAADLYHAGKVRQLIASGDHSTPFYNEPAMMFDDLVERGVSPESIQQDGGGIRTLHSVRRLRTEFDQTDVIIISQRFHVERALYQAHAAGLDAQGFAAADAPFNWHIRVRLREVLARVSAMIDVHLLRRTRDTLPPV